MENATILKPMTPDTVAQFRKRTTELYVSMRELADEARSSDALLAAEKFILVMRSYFDELEIDIKRVQ